MTDLLKLILDESFLDQIRGHCQQRRRDGLQRGKFSGIDRLSLLLLKAVQEEPAILKIASDNRFLWPPAPDRL